MGVTVEHLGPPVDAKSIGEWVKANTIRIGYEALREEVGKGFDNEPVVVTDGVPRRAPESVRPFGRIEFIARPRMAEAVLWALNELQRRSPVLTGRYASSHAILLNGQEVGGNIALALRNVKDGDRVQIVNPQPYAKKIEGRASSKKRGISAVRGQSAQARGGVYRVVQRLLVQRYGRSMFFDFKYVKLSGGGKVWGAPGGRKTPLPARSAMRDTRGRITGWTRPGRVERDAVFPAIQFFIKPTGLPN